MKILMVLESDFPPDTRVENEAISLVNAGHDVHIACLNFKKKATSETWSEIKIHRKAIPSFIYKSSVGSLKFPFYFNFWRKFLSDLQKEHSFDAIHIHDLPLAKIGFELKKKFSLKFVLDLHENWPGLLNVSEHTKSLLGRLLCSITQWRRYEAKYVKKADHVVVVVEEAAIRIAELGVPKKNISVVSNTQNLSEFDFPEQEKDPEKYIIAYGGGVTRHRGLQYAIEAMTLIKSKNVELHIVGDGRYLKDLKTLSANLRLDDKVKFYGWQKRPELLKIISKANAALIPHVKSEHTDSTIPHKIFQYMYSGLPVIASNCKPIERILLETGGGFIFKDADVEGLARLIDNLANKDQETVNKVELREWVEKKYNWAIDEMILKDIYSEYDRK